MKKFSDFKIKRNDKILIGEKISISKILNKKIIVDSYRIEESKYKNNKSGKCLYLQIEVDNRKAIIFTGSDVLIEIIKQLKDDDFPFQTIIIKVNEHFEFT